MNCLSWDSQDPFPFKKNKHEALIKQWYASVLAMKFSLGLVKESVCLPNMGFQSSPLFADVWWVVFHAQIVLC